ncbi:hypothetical protein C8Q78DRAFT_207692 [Trametes maxima]|nr:hypothetical protein C8Q78DRAFT_207692 [Trametes maxima]
MHAMWCLGIPAGTLRRRGARALSFFSSSRSRSRSDGRTPGWSGEITFGDARWAMAMGDGCADACISDQDHRSRCTYDVVGCEMWVRCGMRCEMGGAWGWGIGEVMPSSLQPAEGREIAAKWSGRVRWNLNLNLKLELSVVVVIVVLQTRVGRPWAGASRTSNGSVEGLRAEASGKASDGGRAYAVRSSSSTNTNTPAPAPAGESRLLQQISRPSRELRTANCELAR